MTFVLAPDSELDAFGGPHCSAGPVQRRSCSGLVQAGELHGDRHIGATSLVAVAVWAVAPMSAAGVVAQEFRHA